MLETKRIEGSKLGNVVEVRQLTWGQMLEVMKGAPGDDGFAVQNRLLAQAIVIDGAPVGDTLESLPGAEIVALMPVVQELNPLGAVEGEG